MLPFISCCFVAVTRHAKFDFGFQEHVHGCQGWKDDTFGMKVAHALIRK